MAKSSRLSVARSTLARSRPTLSRRESLQAAFPSQHSLTRAQTNRVLTQALAWCRHPPSHFVQMYKLHSLRGGHVIKLGPGNDEAAREALAAWAGMSIGLAMPSRPQDGIPVAEIAILGSLRAVT